MTLEEKPEAAYLETLNEAKELEAWRQREVELEKELAYVRDKLEYGPDRTGRIGMLCPTTMVFHEFMEGLEKKHNPKTEE